MRIAFVRPNLAAVRSADALEPLALGILSALTPSHHARTLHDERIAPLPDRLDADLVAMTVETMSARRAYAISDALRSRGVPVVMGGHHPTLAPEEAGAHADAIVVGDAEEVWPEVLADADRGALRPRYRGDPTRPLRGLRVDRALFAGRGYPRRPMVQFGRGCPHACDFCSIRAFYGATLRHRPVGEVLEEIDRLPAGPFLFADDNLFTDREAGIALLEGLAPRGRKWGAQIDMGAAREPAIRDRLAAAGCQAVLIGFESLDPRALDQMHKGWNGRAEEYAACVAALRARGIMVYGTFVFGYDHDTAVAFDAAAAFARASALFLANFNPLTPTPGTPLLARLRAEGRLRGDPWWLDPAFRYGHATFRPRAMTPDELEAGCMRARRAFYGWGSIARRALDRRANGRSAGSLALYLAANLISRREIRRKQGRALG